MENQRSEEIYHSLDEAVTHIFGPAARITGRVPVHGGDINRAYKLQISTGFDIFIKENSISNIDFFLTEERGLHALRCTGQIGVPHNMGSGIDRGRNISFLFMEYIESAPRIASYWETFGHQLAAAFHDQSGLGTGFALNHRTGRNRQSSTVHHVNKTVQSVDRIS